MTNVRQSSIQTFAFVIAVSVSVFFSVSFAVSTFSESQSLHKIQLDNRINPNDATSASLIRLPGIGAAKAAAIIAYRANCAGQNPAFQNCDDLQKVRGLGPKTVQNIRQCLKFE